MDIIEKITDNYLNSDGYTAGIEEYWDYVYFVLFSSYLRKSFQETRKKYCLKEGCIKSRTKFVSEDIDNCPDRYANTDFGIDIRDIIRLLSDRQKQVILRYYMLDESDSSIAEKMNISRQAVYRLRCRALHCMKLSICENNEKL